MMIIILTVLKWIGIIILTLLLLLLLLLAIILFVPIRYEVDLYRDKEENGDIDISADDEMSREREYEVKAKVSWLLRLIRFRYILDNEGSFYDAHVGPIKVVDSTVEGEDGEAEEDI